MSRRHAGSGKLHSAVTTTHACYSSTSMSKVVERLLERRVVQRAATSLSNFSWVSLLMQRRPDGVARGRLAGTVSSAAPNHQLQTPLRNPSDAQGAISAPEILEASPRVCPELEGLLLPDWPILRSSFDESDGLKNRCRASRKTRLAKCLRAVYLQSAVRWPRG